MGLFLSTTINKIDKKGRVSIPSGFRAALAAESFQGVVLFQSFTKNAIEGVAMSAMDVMAHRMDDNFALFSDAHDDMATVIFGNSVSCAMDGDGRITLPRELADAIGLTEQAAFVGLGKKFQIWVPEEFEKRQAQARQSAQKSGLTLPAKGGNND